MRVLIRVLMRVALPLSVLLASALPAQAGGQRYEPLADSVRTALSGAVAASRERPQAQFDSVRHKVDWLTRMSKLLPRRWKPGYRERIDFLHTVHYEAKRAGLDPQLVLALIQVESNFRRYAISSAGARGYMQVMPFWADLIGDGNAAHLFDRQTNLRFGCTILRYYIDREKGNLFRALGRYNGSLGKPSYPNKVFKALKRWHYSWSVPLNTAR